MLTPWHHALRAAALAATLLPAVLHAQSPYSIGVFVARDDALPTAPHLGGVSFTSYTGPFGLRLSGALNVIQSDRFGDSYESRDLRVGAWTADADLVLAPLRMAGPFSTALLGFSPYGFVGIGGHGVRFRDTPDTSLATWSYGLGLHRRLIGGLGVEADGRYRMPLREERELPAGFGRDWEYRLGLSVSFGGGNKGRGRRPRDRHHGR
ncbi:MAG: hypothetical protein M3373_09180 [Gemmatimonadota bacterium]|nr:hypothetical protein [Gemmatimonadota bacterium]